MTHSAGRWLKPVQSVPQRLAPHSNTERRSVQQRRRGATASASRRLAHSIRVDTDGSAFTQGVQTTQNKAFLNHCL